MKSFLLSIPRGLPSAIMLLIVLYFTFAKDPLGISSLNVFPYAEQVGHMVLYFCTALVFILDYAKARLPHHSRLNKEVVLAATAATLALVLEIALMYRTNGFNYDILNFVAAIIGAGLALAFYRFWLLHPFRHYLYHSMQHHWRYNKHR